MKHRLESILGYLQTGSYLMAWRALNALGNENEEFRNTLSLEAKTDLDVLHTCLGIVVGERAGHPVAVRNFADTTGLYERMAFLLTRRLLGDSDAGTEIDMLMFCEEALGKVRWN